MKKETLITAFVFFVLGSIAGYVFRAQSSPDAAISDATAGVVHTTQATDAGAGPGGGSLPPGHPAITDQAVIKTFEQQAAANPQDPSPPLQLANYLYDHGSYDQAAVWYEKATQLDPKNVNASTDLGTCYFNLGRYDDALRQFHHSLTIEPRHQPTLYNLIVVNLEGKHDYKSAREAWDTLNRLNPSYPNLDQLGQRLNEVQKAGN